MKRLVRVLGVALLAGCAAGPGQPPAPLIPQDWVGPPRVYSLFGERETLGLTSEQVTALDSVGQALQAENAPIAARVREIRGDDTGRPRTDPQTYERVRPLLEQLRDNNRRAHERVQAVLTEEQERKVCESFGRSRGERGRERERREMEGRRRPGGMRPDSTMMGARATGWLWCGPRPAPGDTTRARP